MNTHKRHPQIADIRDSVLVIIDVQEKLYPHIVNNEKLILNVKKLVKTAKLFKIPIILTEQEKLGQAVKTLRNILNDSYIPIKKVAFSCFEEEEFRKKLKDLKRTTCILTGIESHICIEQTALDLLENDYSVHVVEDAISSRKKSDLETAINKMRSSGVIVTSTEIVMYELMKRADDNRFKEFLEIVKSS